ncbi:MAG: exodeoxyribonuclease VII small subunit [Anaerolinea sp.]|nr:exodeoxyribonuclease VII small subunit [Anaerolinea sp.]
MKPSCVPVNDLTYEQAVAELEEIVNALEDGTAALEETLALFERGQALSQRCAELLAQAELRVEQLSTTEWNDEETE